MWHEHLVENKFLSTLYSEVPRLRNVCIHEVKVCEEGRKVTIRFDMPYYADNPPDKWKRSGYNTVHIEIDFFDIHEIALKSVERVYVGDIEIKSQDSGLVVCITGSLDLLAKVDVGVIKGVRAYTNS